MPGPSTRSRSKQRAYDEHRHNRSNSGCTFCAFEQADGQVIDEYDHFWVVENAFSYDVWDDRAVDDHIMIVPKRHIVGIAEFTDIERVEYMKLVAEYETRNYSLYARAPQNDAKSVTHQHSHLIKVGDSSKRLKLYIHTPHVVVYK